MMDKSYMAFVKKALAIFNSGLCDHYTLLVVFGIESSTVLRDDAALTGLNKKQLQV